MSARLVDLSVHRDQEGGVWGLADLQGAHWRRSQDRPEHLTHARRSRPPSARSLRDETLKAEISKVHKNQLLGLGSPQDARDTQPTRNCLASRCRSCGPLYRRTPHGRPKPTRSQTRQVPAHRENSAQPTLSKGISARSDRTSCGSSTFPRKREVPPPMYAPSPSGSTWLS